MKEWVSRNDDVLHGALSESDAHVFTVAFNMGWNACTKLVRCPRKTGTQLKCIREMYRVDNQAHGSIKYFDTYNLNEVY
jgi:hypothetical protein